MPEISSTTLPVVGQVVVSDPSGSSSGGYALLASSPMVAAEDLDFLERCPGVSEQLHTGSAKGPYDSFHPLPSGSWALTRRFLQGRRRANFHRVVAYTLIVPPQVLASLDVQPLLLAEEERLRPDSAAAPATLSALAAAAVAEPAPAALPDLELVLAGDTRRQAIELLVRHRNELLATWGKDDLASWLTRVLTALAAGYRVLLPQGAEPLLTLAWSALPARDRLESPWTTHFAPGVAVLFRLANAPDAQAAREVHQRPEEWLAVAAEDPAVPPPLAAAARHWASAILGDPDQLAVRLAAADRFGLSLLRRPLDLGRCLEWMECSPRLLREGLPSLQALADFLRDSFPGADRASSPWLGDDQLLTLAGATLGALLSSPFMRGKNFGAAAREVAATLIAGGARPGAEAVAARFRAILGTAVADPTALPLLAAALHALDEGEDKDRRREDLLAVLERQPAPSGGGVQRIAELRGDLALELCRSGSPAGIAALRRLSRLPDELPLFRRLLRPGSEDLSAAAIILRESRTAGPPQVEQDWVGILESVAGSAPQLVESLAPGDLAQACAALRTANPSFMLDAVTRWPGAAREAALDELGSWLAAGHLEAKTVIADLLASGALDALAPTPALGRLSLRALAAPQLVADPLSLALAGARAFDAATPPDAAGYRAGLRAWTLSPPEALAALERALVACRRRPATALQSCGACTRELLLHLRDEASQAAAVGMQAETLLLADEIAGGGLDLAGALLRLSQRAAALGGPEDLQDGWIAQAAAWLLPAPRSERASRVLGLLRSDTVPPSVKDLLQRTLLPELLESLDPQLADGLAELAQDGVEGTLLLAAARRLGAGWPVTSAAAVRFMLRALEHDRVDAVVSLLHRAPARLLAALAPPDRAQLGAALAAAHSRPGGWQLAAFLKPARRPLFYRSRTRP